MWLGNENPTFRLVYGYYGYIRVALVVSIPKKELNNNCQKTILLRKKVLEDINVDTCMDICPTNNCYSHAIYTCA